MSAARRVVIGIENDDGSTVIWRLDAAAGPLEVDEQFLVWRLGKQAPRFGLHIRGSGERIDTEGPVDVQQLPAPKPYPIDPVKGDPWLD